jgi:hypothetical protein
MSRPRKPKHGGTRAGAGRPKLAPAARATTVSITLRMPAETAALLVAASEFEGVSRSKVVAKWCRDYARLRDS